MGAWLGTARLLEGGCLAVAVMLAAACSSDLPAPAAHDGGADGADGGPGGDGGPDDDDDDDDGPDDDDDDDDGPDDDDDDDDDPPDLPPPGPPGGDACPELSCLPCGSGRGCAQGDPIVDGTCCIEGDPLAYAGLGHGSEVVGLEVEGDLAVTCGGFGAVIEDISDPTSPLSIGGASSRCQNAAFAGSTDDDARVLVLAHHGDTWVDDPFLSTYRVGPDNTVAQVWTETEPGVLYEGVTHHDGHVYVAAHGGGVRTYRVLGDGSLQPGAVTGGFDNATEVAASGDHLYVADGVGGVKVLSIADRETPEHVAEIDDLGLARDVAFDDDRLYVSSGGDGVFIFDVSDPTSPQDAGHIEVRGSAQQVDAEGDIIAIAAWTHVAVHDKQTLQLLATGRTRPTPGFEQDTVVRVQGEHVYVGEWENLHVFRHNPGEVAADIFVETDVVSFDGAQPDARVVVVRNLGYLDLDVVPIETTDEVSFSADTQWLRVAPQRGEAFEVAYEPPGRGAPGDSAVLLMPSNDPTTFENPLQLPLVARDGGGLDVGDELTSSFAFVDPTGSPDLQGLEGNVIVLAYFALF